jgi:hypothetical protein
MNSKKSFDMLVKARQCEVCVYALVALPDNPRCYNCQPTAHRLAFRAETYDSYKEKVARLKETDCGASKGR